MSDSRTHQPTAKRRQQARKEGRVVASHLFGGALSWLALAALAYSMASWLLSVSQGDLDVGPSLQSLSGTGLSDFARQRLIRVGTWTLLPLGVVVGVSVFGRLAQVGFLWFPSRVLPDIGRINPTQRLAGLLSAQKVSEVAQCCALIVGAFALIGWGMTSQREQLLQLLTASDLELQTLQLLASWGLRLGGLLLLFACVDYAYRRYRFEQSLYMSPEEVRAEVKAVEGNSQVASERKAMRRAMLTRRR